MRPLGLNTMWLLGAALLGSLGCEELIYEDIDPQIRLKGGDSGVGPDGPPELDVGFVADGVFTSLVDNKSLIIIHGLQGGTWTMPTLRTRGVAAFASIVCTVITDDTGETVGFVDARTKFFPSLDGPLEVQAFPIPINHAAPNEGAPIDDLYGLSAVLDCRVGDEEGREAVKTFVLTLAEG